MVDLKDPRQQEMFAHLFRSISTTFGRCLFPPMTCKEEPIRAHTIQNSKVLDKIVENGHVIGLVMRFNNEKGPILEFKNIGRKEASTFTGLCSSHDQSLFSPIDNNNLDPGNNEHLFLLAYRAILRELHATMDGAIKVQLSYKKRVELGLSPGDQPCPEGMQAVTRMMVAYETNVYKSMFDEVFLHRSYENIEHKVIVIENQKPTIAASTLFSLDKLKIEDDVVRVSLNIVPVDDDTTLVVFSFHNREAKLAKEALNYIFSSRGYHQKYEISRALLNYCENYFIAPSYFNEWSDNKRMEIKDYCMSTMLHNNFEHHSKYLYLF